MIFRQVDEIKSGAKTQTRRVVKAGEWGSVDRQTNCITAVRTDDRIKYELSKTYAIVPKRGAAGIGYIRMQFIDRQRLQNITQADAKAEGVGSVAEYRALWESINKAAGTRWEDNPLVWVYHFNYIDLPF